MLGRAAGMGLAVAAVIVLATQLFNGQPWRKYGTIYASVSNTGNLITHDQVRIGGVRVGQVLDTDIGPDARPRIKLQLDPGTRLPADTRVELRANGLLGGRYVQLIPGRSTTMLADGAIIRGGPHAITYGLPEALDTFDPPTRRNLGALVRETGKGLAGNGVTLNAGLGSAAGEVATFRSIMNSLNAEPTATRRLVPALAAAMAPLARERRRLGGLIAATPAALRPLVSERDAVRSTLERAPSTLRHARDGAVAGTQLLSAVDGLATAAALTLPPAPRGLRATSAALQRAPSALRRGNSLLQQIPTAIPAINKLTRAVSPVLPRIRPALTDLHPMLTELGRYGCDIKNMAVVFRSMTGFGGTAGSGPNGPPMEFRMQLAAPIGPELIGGKAAAGLKRIGYGAPCTYLAKPYPLTGRPQRSKAGR